MISLDRSAAAVFASSDFNQQLWTRLMKAAPPK
jgi:hypothetical protein